jgi:hypothetical protein
MLFILCFFSYKLYIKFNYSCGYISFGITFEKILKLFIAMHANKLWRLIPGINKSVNLMHTTKSTNWIQIRLLDRNLPRFRFSDGKKLRSD